MSGYVSLTRLWAVVFFLSFSLVVPQRLFAECFSVPSTFPLQIHLTCSNGPEFKVVSATGREPAAAKIRLPGPFGSAEFLGVYLKPREVVKLIGVRKRDSGTDQVEQILYAFIRGRKIYWIALALPADPELRHVQAIHNLEGRVQAERISGDLNLPIPRDFKIVEQRLEVSSPEDAYARLGL